MAAILRTALIVLGVGISVQAVFLGLLVLANAVPNPPIVHNLVKALSTGDYGPNYVSDGIGGVQDKWTECIALGYGLGETPYDHSIVKRTVYSPRLDECSSGRSEIRDLSRGQSAAFGQYARYWNGYAVLTRPVLAMSGVSGLRSVVTALFVAAVAFASIAIGGALRWPATVALLAPVAASTNILSSPMSAFTHAIAWSAILIGAGAAAVATRRWGVPGGVAAAALGAAVFNYVDLLTTPAIPWAFSAFIVCATVWASGSGVRRTILALMAASVAWPAAYAFTWVSKWLVSAAFLGSGSLMEVGRVVTFRLSGQYHGLVRESLGAASWRNLQYWLGTVPISSLIVALALVLCAAATIVVAQRRGWRSVAAAALMSSPALIVPVWYEVMKNHSQIHVFFTYRSFPAAIGVLVAATIVAARSASTGTTSRPPRSAEASVTQPKISRSPGRL